MNPALSGAQPYESDEWVYFAGGQDHADKATNVISKVKKVDPTTVERAGLMRVPRVDPFFFKVGDKLVIMGGSEKPLMEVFTEQLQPLGEAGDAVSHLFFSQLACYTTDTKLENCSYG
jgi:hypothetical protein